MPDRCRARPAERPPGEQEARRIADARALVRDVDRHRAGRLADPDRHGPAVVRRRVVHEHTQHLPHGGSRRAGIRCLRLHPQVEAAAAAHQALPPLRRQRVQQRSEIDRAGRRGPLVTSEGQQFVDGGREAIRFDETRDDGRAGILVRPLERGFQPQPEAREGRPQLMRGVGGERPLPLEQIVQPAGGRVQCRTHRIDLFDPAFPAADTEVTLTQPTRTDGQVLQRLQPSGLPTPDQPCDCHRQCRQRSHGTPHRDDPRQDSAVRSRGPHRTDHVAPCVTGTATTRRPFSVSVRTPPLRARESSGPSLPTGNHPSSGRPRRTPPPRPHRAGPGSRSTLRRRRRQRP
jgi:hypothetical protein